MNFKSYETVKIPTKEGAFLQNLIFRTFVQCATVTSMWCAYVWTTCKRTTEHRLFVSNFCKKCKSSFWAFLSSGRDKFIWCTCWVGNVQSRFRRYFHVEKKTGWYTGYLKYCQKHNRPKQGLRSFAFMSVSTQSEIQSQLS